MKKVKGFFKKHWIDIIVIAAVIGALIYLGYNVYYRFNFEKKWNIFYNYFFTNGGYKKLLTGMQNTALIAVLGLVIGSLIGTVIVCGIYVAFFRGTPIVVQLLLGYYIILPLLSVTLSPVTSCIIIFGLNSGAYISEIMRGGINSVDPGQLEAARAVGLPFSTSMLKIVVPQAVKNILPTMGNEFIALVKDTSVVSFVAAVDLYKTFIELGNVNYEYIVPYLTMAIIYIVLVGIISWGVKILERRLKRNER